MVSFNLEEIGLKIGLEIHQQLATKNKLFCECKTFTESDFKFNFIRRLRPTQSELGQIDPAALFEFKKGTTIKYLAGKESACLVEADEEPPHDINKEAIETAILIALILNSNIVDEMHVMRKIVIDGSNTTGFQRTLIVALGGALKVGNKIIPIQTICLEEDACRLLNEGEKVREYSLDRLGVPLIEVSLAPFTGTPQEVQEVALALGRLLRSTKRVARGLGTIRQDLNISIKNGGVVEVKGIQKLDLLGKIVEYEVHRQLALLNLSNKLKERGLTSNDFNEEFLDVSDIFKDTSSSILKRALERKDWIIALKLKNCKGLLKYEPYPDIRLGKELADLVRFYGLGGIIHSDELPNYGISEQEVNRVRERLSLHDEDAFILLTGSEYSTQEALKAVVNYLHELIKGVPSETRGPTADGKTRFTRPRPGAARMYPETDIPPFPISEELIKRLSLQIPKPWQEQVEEFKLKYGLSDKLALQIYDSEYIDIFNELVSTTKVAPSFIATVLLETLVNISRSGLDTSRINDSTLRSLFKALDEGRISKEAVQEILEIIAKGEVNDVDSAIKKLKLFAISDEELEDIINKIIQEDLNLVKEKGEYSFNVLMGKVMKIVRGKVDGKKVSTLLKEKIKEVSTLCK